MKPSVRSFRHDPWPSKRTCLLFSGILAVALFSSMSSGHCDEKKADAGQLIDLNVEFFGRPAVSSQLLNFVPRDWPGPRGPQPYNQVPPDAQRDFRDLTQEPTARVVPLGTTGIVGP